MMNSRFCKNLVASAMLTSALLATVETSAAYPRLNLPQMGEPADLVMSPRDEKRIGRGYMRQIRTHLNLVRDPEVNDYVQCSAATYRQTLREPGQSGSKNRRCNFCSNPDFSKIRGSRPGRIADRPCSITPIGN